MKLGTIKIEALKLMNVEFTADIEAENLSAYEDYEEYKDYLLNMTGAINRCFSVIENKRVLPTKSFDFTRDTVLASGNFNRIDLNDIKDFYDIDRVVKTDDFDCYEGDCEYKREGNFLVVQKLKEGEKYIVVYYPTIDRVSAASENDIELDIPNYIASHIPYFIKGDLYRIDEPNEANEARNWFEQAMQELQGGVQGKVSKVKTVFKQTE